jgi:hypothetical protein
MRHRVIIEIEDGAYNVQLHAVQYVEGYEEVTVLERHGIPAPHDMDLQKTVMDLSRRAYDMDWQPKLPLDESPIYEE